MRLEPVFLLAPKPKPPSIPTRRAFLIAGGTFFAGIGLGGACGYAAGVSGRGEGVGVENDLPPSSGNAELDELRRLALKAPIEELVGSWSHFTDAFAVRYRDDGHLLRGVERLIKHVLQESSVEQRTILSRVLAQTVQLGELSTQEKLGHYIPELLRIR